jgi:hypothetical protein
MRRRLPNAASLCTPADSVWVEFQYLVGNLFTDLDEIGVGSVPVPT